MKNAPKTFNGKNKTYEGWFFSPLEKNSKDEALQILDELRKIYTEEIGWLEIYGDAEKLENGKWRAVRYHAHYN